MAFRFRAFFPYTLPGVLALIGWWWFFSRKKQQIISHDGQAPANVCSQQTEATKTECLTTEDLNCIKAQPVYINQEKCQENDLGTESSEEIPLFETQQPLSSSVINFSCPIGNIEANIHEPSDKKYQETWKTVPETSNIQENNCPLKTSTEHHSFSLPRLESHSQEIQMAEMLSPVIEPEEKFNCSSDKMKTKCEAKQAANKVLDNEAMTIKCTGETSLEIIHMPAVYHKPEKEAATPVTLPCDQLVQPIQVNEIASMQAGARTTTLKVVVGQPAIVNEMLFMDKGSQTIEEKRVGSPVFNEIVEKDVQTSADENMTLHSEPCKTISTEKGTLTTSLGEQTFELHKIKAIALIEKGTQAATIKRTIQDKEVVMEKDDHVAAVEEKESNDILPLEKDAQTASLEKAITQCNETEETSAVENESVVTGKLLNSYIECDLRENDGSDSGNMFSLYQGKTNEYCETMKSVVGSLGREKTEDEGLVKEEAEKIEQVAINIISKVILAATKEILACATTDMSDSGKVLEHESDCLLERGNGIALASQKFIWEQNVMKCNRESETDIKAGILTKQNLSEEEKHGEGEGYISILKNVHLSSPVQGDPAEHKPKNLILCEQHEKILRSVPCLGESFEETNVVTEDSGCSVCTSEDGIGSEDPLQSTAFSCIAAKQHFDFLNTSRIGDTSVDQDTVPTEEPLTHRSKENKNILYSNGIQKGSSPDLRNDGQWSTETEADHSGGSDVNSMDSVDSGCAPGKTKNIQNDKQGTECKKSELIIWEIEVPKHLVGRLIGKQGRYVSFLKQTSGAKIYISTLPYTQEFQICHIEGSQQQVDRALNMIGKKFKELNLTNIYAPPPPPLTLPSLPMTSWLMLPDGITVEVIVVNVVNAGHMFVQQHTHPTFHALRSLDQQMYLCYSQPGIPTLPTPVEVGVICAAPGVDGAWWRAQVVAYHKDVNEVEIRYVDYGGYERVNIEILRQIRSDFVTLPFQGAEVLLDNVIPLPDEDQFSSEADVTVNEMTRGTALLAQVTNYDGVTGLPLIQLWSMLGDEVVSINRALVERGFAQWIDSY